MNDTEPVSEKIIEKIRKLANMSGRTEAEAQAFADKVQELLGRHKLDMTDIQFEDFKLREQVDKHLVDWAAHDVHVRSRRIRWIEDLAAFVANAYFCRTLIYDRSSYISFVGRKSDARVAEYVLVTLVRQAEKIADAAYTKHFYECRDRGDVRAARGFRQAFLMGFVHRIAARLAEKKAQMMRESTALVRFSMKDIDDYFKKNDIQTANKLAKTKFHPAGYQTGTEAANKVNLDGKAVEHEGSRKREISGT